MRMFRKLTSLKLFDISVASSRVEIVGSNAVIYGVKREDFIKVARVEPPCVMEVSGHSYPVIVNGANRVPEALTPEVINIYLEVESPTGDALYMSEEGADVNRVES